MSIQDIYLLLPEISIIVLALVVMGLDLFVTRKSFLSFTSVVGLVVPIAFTLILWCDVDSIDVGEKTGVFGAVTIDKFGLFFKFLVLGITCLVILASVDYRRNFKRLQGEFIGLMLMSAAGMMALASATELITIYVSLELTVLPMVAVVAFLMTPRSSEAGLKFLVLNGVSSVLLLYGIVLVLGYSGTTLLPDIKDSLALQSLGSDPSLPFGNYGLLLGAVLMVSGFGFKISSVPFQMWVPDVYEGGSTPAVAFLSVASKAIGFAVLLRVLYIAFPGYETDWAMLFAVLAALSMTIGNMVAMVQDNIKRLLGYSTIAHAGYMMIGIAAVAGRIESGGEAAGVSSLLFYLVAYAATNLAGFFAIIAISNKIESDRIQDFAGIGKRAPVISLVLALALISLIGIPPTGLFIGKIFLFSSAVQADLAWLAVFGVVNSVVSAYYYLKVVRVMYIEESASEEKIPSTTSMRLALAISGSAIILLGIAPRLLTWVTDVAAGPLKP
ncbi:NADH-quinone oxidoreductase subunit N [SAR202 cluster bacterium AD-804-J14_MRT_500m]|nr:NADH-quinone oxidoreductase subunit N [SAR202 cluster bacterium AD-804-J14_MRT_500m]